MNFQNKVAVITGGSAGMGYALSKELVAAGMKVYSLSRSKPAELVEGVTYLSADVSKEAEVRAAAALIAEPVDLLVNNAGVMRRGHYWEIGEEQFDLVWNVDVKGFWLVFKYFREKLVKGAVTLQINSKNALSLKADTFVYTLSKLADLNIDQIVAKDRVDLDMRVAHFGPVDTVLEWTDYSNEQKAEKMKMALTVDESAKLTMDLLRSDLKQLVFVDRENRYEMV
jgi:NAD(P)-dependent dehydrogenase (short-subunit alcohol dehydrogenase family)